MRYLTMCTAKIHRAVVTGADANYEGSITLDPELMDIAGIFRSELVHINGVRAGQHWETYVVPAAEERRAKGDVILNGPPAALFAVGDIVVINRFEQVSLDHNREVTRMVLFIDPRDNACDDVDAEVVLTPAQLKGLEEGEG